MCLLIVAAAHASAQQSLYLVRDDARPDRVLLQLGQPARPEPWTDHRLAWFFIRGDGTQRNLSQVTAALDDASAVTLPQIPQGCAVIGADFAPRIEILAAADWAVFLKTRSSAPPPELGAAPARVRRIESCKTILRAAPGGDDSAVSKTGQAVEIRSLMDPTATPPGSDVALRAFVDGNKVAGAHLIARHIESGRTQDLITNPEGIANLRITDAGPWHIEFHRATRLAGDAEADWELRTATLTFKAPVALPEVRP